MDLYKESESDSIKQLNREQLIRARQTSNFIENAVHEYGKYLSFCSKQKNIIDLNSEGKELISHIYNLNSENIKAITLIDSNGIIFYTYPHKKEVIGKNISLNENIKKLIKSHSSSLSNLLFTFRKNNSISLYYPIFKNKIFVGGIGFRIPFDDLIKKALKGIKINKSNYIWIIDHDGNILFHPDSTYCSKNSFDIFNDSPSTIAMLKNSAKGISGSAETEAKINRENLETIYNIYYPISVEDTHWSIIMTTPKKEITSMMKGFLVKLIIISVFLISGVSIYLYYIIKAQSILREENLRKKAEVDLMNSEKKFKKLVDVSPDAILLMDIHGKILICNRMAARLTGYDDPDELIGKDSLQFISSEDRRRAKDNFNRTIEESVTREFQYDMIKKDGSIYSAELSAAIITDINDNPIGFAGIIRDITERKKIEQMLLDAKEAAEESDKFKSEFLAQMSHEIRSPINAILSFAGLLQDEIYDIVPVELRDCFSIMKNAGKRIIRTVDLILNMSELETGTFEASYRTVKIISEILDQINLEFMQTAKEKGLEFIFINKTGFREIYLTGDEYTLGQIFNNLINNAIKFTDKGKVELIIFINDEGKLEIKVSDTGIGMSDKYLKNLFKPFSQEEQGYSRRFEGNGLGLALVKKYCEINNAYIEVESEKGKGTTFSVIFNEQIISFEK